MREIKFRVYDKRLKIMLDVDGDDLYIADGKIYDVNLGFYSYEAYLDKEDVTADYELMQYTGLKDKNGKEIYEGDIVRVRLEDETKTSHTSKVSITSNGVIIDGHPVHVEMGIGGLRGLTQYCTYGECEVVGNIYENTDLLKGCE